MSSSTNDYSTRDLYRHEDESDDERRGSSGLSAGPSSAPSQSEIDNKVSLRLKEMGKKYGFSPVLPKVSIDIASVSAPTQQEFDLMLSRFANAVNATTQESRNECFITLLVWFYVNTTSDKVDLSIVQRFPTGKSLPIEKAWEPLAGMSLRSSLRNSYAQDLMYAIASSSEYSDIINPVCKKRSVDIRFKAVAFDFFSPDYCTLASEEEQNYGKAYANSNLRGSSARTLVKKDKNSGSSGNSPRFHSAPSGNDSTPSSRF